LSMNAAGPFTSRLRADLKRSQPVLWLNPNLPPAQDALDGLSLGRAALDRAVQAFQRWSPVLHQLFADLPASGFESGLEPLPNAETVLAQACHGPIWLKRDDTLPIVGSIKARGGCYEVLHFAETLARAHGLTKAADLVSPAARALFAQHTIAVGSTGNLGLSIGTLSAALGFKAVVHMSHDAKAWKKARLRSKGAEVIEHQGDYATAVATGRNLAAASQTTYFVDDENSQPLFLGYAAAAVRLKDQLAAANIAVDAAHPLIVHLPCGVGGAPGGIIFGLKHVFGDAVHCFLAEPVASPCMLVRLALGPGLSVYDLGLDNRTAADGLAVPQASELAWAMIHQLVAGAYTVTDAGMFGFLQRAHTHAGFRLEPSAVAGFAGPYWTEVSGMASSFRANTLRGAAMTHVLWCTGGSLVPDDEHSRNQSASLSMEAPKTS
jgi:D-serine dehydratase